ncbi:MAG TPA: DUF6010 family protein [Chitinophagaceae bacterium]|nr:DUF6010 family protein [Chitinophagaceae bacterium]
MNAVAAIVIAFLFILVMSLVKEPGRQKINAFIIAGAGSVYWNGGLGVWEFAFSTLMLVIAVKGLKHYYFTGIGWLLHTGWDILHHLYGHPIVYLEPSSSAGCAVCDPILAAWFFFGAPSIFNFFKRLPITAA